MEAALTASRGAPGHCEVEPLQTGLGGCPLLRVEVSIESPEGVFDGGSIHAGSGNVDTHVGASALDLACEAMTKSRDQLEHQLRLLDEVGVQLEEAGKGLRQAYTEVRSAAKSQIIEAVVHPVRRKPNGKPRLH